MATISKVACGLLAAMQTMIAISHLKDPESSLRDFGVKGPISPIAMHCCAVIGSSSFPALSMLIYAIFAPASVRRVLALCYCTTIPPAILVQVWYPFNSPAPVFPAEMPYPVLIIMTLLGGAAVIFAGEDTKPKQKK